MPKTATRRRKKQTDQGAPGVPRSTPTPEKATAYGRELKQIREELGYTQMQMASALGFTGSRTISRLELGERQVSETTIRLARKLRRGH